MPKRDFHHKSEPVVISEHRQDWADEFVSVGTRLREVLGTLALRVDHIGSTSVPGLAAKDIIDVQVTVEDLNHSDLIPTLTEAGYTHRGDIGCNNFLGIADPSSVELRKVYFREPPGERQTNIHIRENGRLNQRYALLFRDYIRCSVTIRRAYELIKVRLAEIFPDSIEGYLYIKDPLMDLMFEAAQTWAEATNWVPDEKYL